MIQQIMNYVWGALSTHPFNAATLLIAAFALYFTARSASAADSSARAAKLSAEVGQRAWVCLTHHVIIGEGAPAAKAIFRVGITNVGLSPAFDSRLYVYWMFAASGVFPEQPPYMDQTGEVSHATLGPGQMLGSNLEIVLTPEQWKRIRTGQDSLYVYGVVRYRSIVLPPDKEHETRFAVKYVPSEVPPFRYTKHHNSVT
jgi:hypothetical protein